MVAAGSATHVGMVRLGAPQAAGFGDWTRLTFDSYQANRTLPVGPLLDADANNDLEINIFDFGFVRNEILGNSLATGQPDCNRDGEIDIFDFGCIRNIILGN